MMIKKNIVKFALFILAMQCLVVFIPDEAGNLIAQRRRRTSSSSSSGSIFDKLKKTAEPQPTNTGETKQIEVRNRELLQQIISLKDQRDFYKNKLLDWAEKRSMDIQDSVEVETEKPEPQKAMSVPDTIYIDKSGIITQEDSLYIAAQNQAALGHYNLAKQTFSKLTETKKCTALHYLEFGKLLYKLGNYSRAIAVLQNIGNDSLLSYASFYKGRSFQENGAFHIGKIELYRCKILNGQYHGYEIGTAFEKVRDGEYESAEKIFNSYAKTSESLKPEIFLGLAEIQVVKGDTAKATEYYKKSIGYDPQYMKSVYNLGMLFLKTRQYQPSIFLLSKALQYSNFSEDFHFQIGQAYYFLKEWDQAVTEFSKMPDELSDSSGKKNWISKSYYLKSLLLKEQGEFAAATKYIRLARETSADAVYWMTESLDDLSKIYKNDMQYNEALNSYLQLIRLHPNDVRLKLNLGILYFKNGDIEEAKKLLINALCSEKTRVQAQYWLDQINYF